MNDFLHDINLTEEEYVLAVRSSLRGPKVFFKRNLDEIRTNNYNPLLLECWRANMDFQFIIDAYSCAMYIVNYIAKSQRGMSNLLYHACEEAKRGNVDLKKQVKMIGNKFLDNVEVSAQEAVYLILQLHLHKASRDTIFINTSPPSERTVMMKNFTVLQTLPDDSTDITALGLLDHYSMRPTELENISLADYVSRFTRRKKVDLWNVFHHHHLMMMMMMMPM